MSNDGPINLPPPRAVSIIAIDPGNKQSAYVVYNGAILDFGIVDNEKMLGVLNQIHVKVQTMVIEKVCSYGMAVGETVFDTVFWTGRFCQRWGYTGWERVPRMEVKMHLCHSSRAKDSNIRQALIDRFGEQGTKKSPGKTYGISKDVWAALALAVTYHDKLMIS